MGILLRHRTFIRTRRRFSDALLIGVLLAVLASGAAEARGLRLGFYDGGYVGDASTRATALARTKSVNGTIVRLGATWAGIAPTQPKLAVDPNDPAYRWAGLDAAVQDAVAAGLTPMITFNSAPTWAEGPKRPKSAGQGTWRPRISSFRNFMIAAAQRYSGDTPGIPRVRYWQVWNEPNLATYLTPQYVKKRGRWAMASPGIFRALVNAGYAAVHSVHKDNFLITAGTAPYGDLAPGGRRIAPVNFLRAVLAKRTYLDAISHHPYGVGSPYRHALNGADVAVPDIGKLRRVLRAAEKKKTVYRNRQIWVTEMSWDSKPPDPDGVSERTQADWLQEGFNVLWKQGVSTITWFQVTDQPGPNYPASNQSGVFFVNGKEKLSATAFRFPFIAPRDRSGRAQLWGRATAAGRVVVERFRGNKWRATWSKKVRLGTVFTGQIAVPRGTRLRARMGDIASLTWRVR